MRHSVQKLVCDKVPRPSAGKISRKSIQAMSHLSDEEVARRCKVPLRTIKRLRAKS